MFSNESMFKSYSFLLKAGVESSYVDNLIDLYKKIISTVIEHMNLSIIRKHLEIQADDNDDAFKAKYDEFMKIADCLGVKEKFINSNPKDKDQILGVSDLSWSDPFIKINLDAKPDYRILAHELGHVLMQSAAHDSESSNFMYTMLGNIEVKHITCL